MNRARVWSCKCRNVGDIWCPPVYPTTTRVTPSMFWNRCWGFQNSPQATTAIWNFFFDGFRGNGWHSLVSTPLDAVSFIIVSLLSLLEFLFLFRNHVMVAVVQCFLLKMTIGGCGHSPTKRLFSLKPVATKGVFVWRASVVVGILRTPNFWGTKARKIRRSSKKML